MKIIVLIPTKNEEWILDYTLSTLQPFVDHIIIADQKSTDSTRDICKRYSKVTLIDNKEVGHSNRVRWTLLDEARKIPGENLILCIDADELLAPSSFDMLRQKAEFYGPGTIFCCPWIQIWKDITKHRIDGVWKANYKAIAFYDDRKVQYEKLFVINDHTSRTPTIPLLPTIQIENAPLLHLQFLAWKRAYTKQAWYRCSELIRKPKSYRYINYKYSPTEDGPQVITQNIPAGWLEGLSIPSELTQTKDIDRETEILSWFKQYGVVFFEHLNIWEDEVLLKVFMDTTNKKPRVYTYPILFIKINKLRQKAKRLIASILK